MPYVMLDENATIMLATSSSIIDIAFPEDALFYRFANFLPSSAQYRRSVSCSRVEKDRRLEDEHEYGYR